MTDFEKMIREMVNAGAKMEDIAKVTGDTLNAIQKEQETKENDKSKRYRELESEFHNRYKDGHLGIEEVGILAALVTSPSYPNWTVDNLDEFAAGVAETIKMRAEMVGKSLLDGIMTAFDMAGEIGKEKTDAMFGKSKSHGKSAQTCNSGGKCVCKSSKEDKDKERVNQFLKDLGIDIRL